MAARRAARAAAARSTVRHRAKAASSAAPHPRSVRQPRAPHRRRKPPRRASAGEASFRQTRNLILPRTKFGGGGLPCAAWQDGGGICADVAPSTASRSPSPDFVGGGITKRPAKPPAALVLSF